MKKWKGIGVCLLLIATICISACKDNEVHEEQYESNVIRIYDVEPLETYDVQCDQHYMRVGILPNIEKPDSTTAPFANQIEAIEKETGTDIEYIVVSSWEELRKEQEVFEDANVTEMILFNNTYDESIIKEATSGKYADMEAALEEYGFYDEEAYNQEVLQAGMLETGQMLVPVLYNVSGMIHGDALKYEYEEWKELAYGHAEDACISYEGFIAMLTDAMLKAELDETKIPYLSGADYEGKIDLFLLTAGQRWDGYEEQKELFDVLYEYLKNYREMNVKTNKHLYIEHLKENQYTEAMNEKGVPVFITREIVDDLQIESSDASIDPAELFMHELAVSMFDRTEYFIESTGADDIAFHSVYGLLGYRNYYVVRKFSSNNSMTDFQVNTSGNMEYWPIGIYGEEAAYAAQPICYAAVVNGGNTRLAAKVIQSMMNQETDIKFGISVSATAMEKQVGTWISTHDDIGKVRVVKPAEVLNGVQEYSVIHMQNYLGTYFASKPSMYFEDKEIYAGQINEQIENIVIAQIPDRELLSIWNDTLNEAIDTKLSADEGYALLCERMDAWYK